MCLWFIFNPTYYFINTPQWPSKGPFWKTSLMKCHLVQSNHLWKSKASNQIFCFQMQELGLRNTFFFVLLLLLFFFVFTYLKNNNLSFRTLLNMVMVILVVCVLKSCMLSYFVLIKFLKIQPCELHMYFVSSARFLNSAPLIDAKIHRR